MLSFGNKEFRNLQEQVLKNAQDIETLKGRENLKIVIVEELPEVGNPNYIYLVPNEDGDESNIYNEYIWLADEEAYEQIGAVNIDLTNYVTTDTEQTISGSKTFSSNIIAYSEIVFDEQTDPTNYWSIKQDIYNNLIISRVGSNKYMFTNNFFSGMNNNERDLGSTQYKWKDLYLAGKSYFIDPSYSDSNSWQVYAVNQFNLMIARNGTNRFMFQQNQFSPTDYQNPQCNLGSINFAWKDLYLTGNISDGANTITVANIASKVTSTYASGTFDASGEDTIDISGGTPEGLFIFTYGSCQCFVRLTASMILNADAVPINVSCPMIYNNTVSLGWFSISRGGDTLTITVTDGMNRVDSGYSWTLVKTNLI